MDLSVEFNVPIGFGILTCFDLEQAEEEVMFIKKIKVKKPQ